MQTGSDAVGEWMKVHGESIYGTKGGPYKPTDRIASTRKGNNIYLHVMKWPDPETSSFHRSTRNSSRPL